MYVYKSKRPAYSKETTKITCARTRVPFDEIALRAVSLVLSSKWLELNEDGFSVGTLQRARSSQSSSLQNVPNRQ